MDVHPPLAKLLITLAGWLGGFDGDFDFKDIGKDYLEPGVPYVAMRLVSAIFGILTIPTMFLTLKTTGCRTVTAAFGSALLIFGRPAFRTIGAEHRDLTTPYRERSLDAVTTCSAGLSLDHLHSFYCPGFQLLHKST